MKVRAILEYKKLPFDSVSVRGRIGEIRRRGGVGKVPAVEIDGEFVADSTDIAYALEERFPDPPILPADLRERGLCHALEDWADESLYFIGLYYRWYEREGRKPIPHVFGKSLRAHMVYRLYLRRILAQLRGQGTLRKPPEHVRRDLDRHLDAIERMLSRRKFLLGDQPWLCDFALWGQLNYLARTPIGAEAIRGRKPIEAFIDRLAPPRH
jgi:glutathione S-transferase